jgi:hypothetical protein
MSNLNAATGTVNARAVVQAAYNLVSANSHLSRGEQAGAVFALFVAITERAGIHPHEAINRAQRYLKNGDIAREVSALKQYVDEELVK